MSSHVRAVLQALFITCLWSTWWVIINLSLKDIPALTFAGLRFSDEPSTDGLRRNRFA